jgi:hypothetical protein
MNREFQPTSAPFRGLFAVLALLVTIAIGYGLDGLADSYVVAHAQDMAPQTVVLASR